MLLLVLGSLGCGGHRSVLGASLGTSSWATPGSGTRKLDVTKKWLPPGCNAVTDERDPPCNTIVLRPPRTMFGCTADVPQPTRASVGMDRGTLTILPLFSSQSILFFSCCPCSMYPWLPGTAPVAVRRPQLPNKFMGWAFLASLKDLSHAGSQTFTCSHSEASCDLDALENDVLQH